MLKVFVGIDVLKKELSISMIINDKSSVHDKKINKRLMMVIRGENKKKM